HHYAQPHQRGNRPGCPWPAGSPLHNRRHTSRASTNHQLRSIMTTYNTTELYQQREAAEAAFNAACDAGEAFDRIMALMHAADAATEAYEAARSAVIIQWTALPAGYRKDSAEQNAYDTEGTDVDALRWHEIALMTYAGFDPEA